MADVFAYVGTYTKENGSLLKRNACANGISVFKIEGGGDVAWELIQEEPILNPCVFELAGNRTVLYSISADSNLITAFSIDADSGKMKMFHSKAIEDAEKLAVITVTQLGDRLLAADFKGNIYVVSLLEDGFLGDVCSKVSLSGKAGPLRETWQPCSRPHQIVISGDDKFVYIPDKGFDKIHTYKLSAAPESKLSLCSQVDVRRAGCPRHLVISPDGRYLYCNLEFGNAVLACELINGLPDPFQMISTLPETFVDPVSKTAEIKIHPSGRWLYVSNRGHNSIAVFEIDHHSGFLKVIQFAECGGGIPRSFEIDDSGRKLLCCNQFSNEIVPFDINCRTGILTTAEKPIQTPCPVWLKLSGSYPARKIRKTVEGIT